ncbi:hypothetical protein LVJ94_18655 [Pendulispora rubella]|uniref:Uncharacterized protein n=1 Tax=Pendulispora rubella TaxID=2741070 RepID=A0ABZ2LE74_9BACT
MPRRRRTLVAWYIASPFFLFGVYRAVGLFVVRNFDLGALSQERRTEQIREQSQAHLEQVAQEHGMTADELRARLAEDEAREAARAAPVETGAALQTLAREASSRKAAPVAVAAYALLGALQRRDCGAATVAAADLDAKIAASEEGSTRETLTERAVRVHRGMALICTNDL